MFPPHDPLSNAADTLRRALTAFARPALAWTGGKDSTLCLWLCRRLHLREGLPLPELFTIDEGDPFPELEAFMAGLVGDWGLELTTLRHPLLDSHGLGQSVSVEELEADERHELLLAGHTGARVVLDPETPEGNQILKTAVLKRYLAETDTDALVTGLRRDEHPARASESALSPRHAPPHTRVHPLLDLSERQVWEAAFGHGVPFCELYRQGYRSLGTRGGTVREADIPAWEQDLEKGSERGGRARDKEEAMAQLRSLGYL